MRWPELTTTPMPRTLLKNLDILTLDDAGTILRNSNIAIDGKTILAVGESPANFTPDEVIDGYNHVALPGFFNGAFEWRANLNFARQRNRERMPARQRQTRRLLHQVRIDCRGVDHARLR